MANRQNDVFNVLVTSGNQAVLGQGLSVDALAPGQIGIFDADTHLVPASGVSPKSFYLAVGIGSNGTLKNIRHSAGDKITTARVNGYGYKPHSAGRPQIVQISDIAAKCDREYGIRVEISNSRIDHIQGNNQFSQAFIVKGACCPDCGDDDCSQADANDVAIKLVNSVNTNSQDRLIANIVAGQGSITVTGEPTADENVTITLGDEAAFTVAILDADDSAGVATKIAAGINGVSGSAYTATSDGAVVTIVGPDGTVTFGAGTTGATATTVAVTQTVVTDTDAFSAAYSNAVYSIQIQAVELEATSSSSINLHYHKRRETTLIVSLIEGFNCSGTVATVQETAYEEGNGSDVRQVEYNASGWLETGPYVASELLGLAKENVEYLADANEKYDQFTIEYTEKHQGGWRFHENTLATYIAVPADETTTLNSLVAQLDDILGPHGFDDLADDVAAADTDPDVVEPAITDLDTDGVA